MGVTQPQGAVDMVWSRLPGGVRNGVRSACGVWSRATASRRVLPDFVIVGAQRGGTTSLYNYIAAHPLVSRALTKELRYFDLHYDKGTSWYRSRFPSARRQAGRSRRLKGTALTGEASPDYLFYPQVPPRLAGTVPQAKLIVLLRDPVERAWSHWWHQVRRGFEALSFEAALDAEEGRCTPGLLDLGPRDQVLTFEDHHFSYTQRGQYAPQLERWLAFFPPGQLLVLRSETLFNTPERAVREVEDFLGLPSWQPPTYETYNRMASGAMGPETRKRLIARFEPHNQRLEALLDMRFEWQREIRGD